jgi:excisionase family DNA binding protein
LNQVPRAGIDHPALERRAATERLAAALRDFIVLNQMVTASGEDWIDQAASPLGRKRHLELARDGLIPSSRVGRKVLMRRRDIDEFLHRHGPAAQAEERAEVEVATDVMASLGLEVRRRSS